MSSKKLTEAELAEMNPLEFRNLIRCGEWTEHVLCACSDFAKFNLAIVPKDMSFEFLLFAQRNTQACAVTDITEPGDPHPKLLALDADLRTDLPRYRVYQDGQLVDEPTNISRYWRDDLVAFLIGGITNVYAALGKANVRYRLIGDFTTNMPTISAGRFYGPLVVSCTLFKTSYDAVRAVQISSRLPAGHGAPVHIGNPTAIGIKDLYHPDIFSPGPTASPETGEIPMYWGCGVTPALAAMAAKIPLMITHKPAHFFISDRRVEEMAIL